MQTITTATTPGHRPQQLILELGGENKPVCWLRDISTLIVLIGSKLKYASMVQVVLFPFWLRKQPNNKIVMSECSLISAQLQNTAQ